MQRVMQHMTQRNLDRTDLKILDVLQQQGNLSAAEIAEKVGLTATTAWRRISRLEEEGVIRQRVALLNREAVGLSVTVFAQVRLSTQGREAISRFEQVVRKHPEIMECYTMLGETDFLLRIVARDIRAYEAFYLDHLSRFPGSPGSQLIDCVVSDQGDDSATAEQGMRLHKAVLRLCSGSTGNIRLPAPVSLVIAPDNSGPLQCLSVPSNPLLDL